MAHEIEKNNAFYVKAPAWHELGVVLEDAPTIQAAVKIAYPYTITKYPCAAVVNKEENLLIDSPEHTVIVRSDGKVLGCMGKDYTFEQPEESFSFFAPFIDQGLVELESGMSLRDGKRLAILARVKNGVGEVVKGDEIKAYYLIYTSFDGSLSHGIMPTNTRVVCANTLRAAINTGGKNSFKLKHTKNLFARIEDAQSLIAETLNQFRNDLDCYRLLAKTPCTDMQLEKYIRDVFETPEEPSTRAENRVQDILEFTLRQPEIEKVAIAGTMWNAYNGITNYLSHEYGRSAENRTDSLWFGQSANVSDRALMLAMIPQ